MIPAAAQAVGPRYPTLLGVGGEILAEQQPLLAGVLDRRATLRAPPRHPRLASVAALVTATPASDPELATLGTRFAR